MATAELTTYQVSIIHPAGIPVQLMDHVDEEPMLVEVIKQLSMEHASISVQLLHELNHTTDSFEVGVVRKDDETDDELSIMFITQVHLADDNAAMCLLDSIKDGACEHTVVCVQPRDETGISDFDIDPSIFDRPADENDTDDEKKD